MQNPKGFSFIHLREKISSPFKPIKTQKEAHFIPFPYTGDQNKSSPPLDSPSSKETLKEKEKQKKHLLDWQKKILTEAQQKAEEIKAEAYREGLTKGKEKGKKEVLNQLAPLKESLKKMIEQIEYTQTAILKNQEKEILHLCIQMAEKIIHTEIQQNPQILLANLREGLKSFGRHKITAIKLNPRDLDFLQNCKENISQSILNLQGIDLKVDPNLLQGGCLIETDLGYVDASIENQLQELKKTIGETQGEVKSES